MLTPLLTSIPLTDNNNLTISTCPLLQAAYSGVYKLHINTFKLNQYLHPIKMFINTFKLNQYLHPIKIFINTKLNQYLHLY